MNIGLLMVNGEDDILEETLELHARLVDCFYVLDGTEPNGDSQITCRAHPKCAAYTTDAELPRDRYGARPVDGWRQHLLEQAYAEHGHDHWFLLLHADEVWTFHPAHVAKQHPEARGFVFPLPCYFPREGQGWHDDVSPLEQLGWHLGPGWPEFRLFRGGPRVRFNVAQHFNTRPLHVTPVVGVDLPIKHYPYRSPASQWHRAAIHQRTGFDPDNYRHVVEAGQVFWSDEMIDSWRKHACFHRLANDALKQAVA